MASSIILLCQTQVQLADFHWMYAEPKSIVSADWAKTKVRTQSELANLSANTAKERIDTLTKRCRSAKSAPSLTPSEIYFLSSAYVEYFPELRKTTYNVDIEQILWKKEGANDPEFMRMAYAALCRKRSPGKWGTLGVKLRKIFPNDLLTKQSFVKDCIFGELPLNYVYEGRTILNRDLKSDYSEYGFVDLSANLEMNLYFRTKRKIHLDSSIYFLEKLISLQKKRGESTKGSEAWLPRLKKFLAEKEYIED